MKKLSNRQIIVTKNNINGILLAPTDLQVHDYNQELYLAHRRSGMHYQTGPRYAQQLADRTLSGKVGVAKYKTEQARVAHAKAAQ